MFFVGIVNLAMRLSRDCKKIEIKNENVISPGCLAFV